MNTSEKGNALEDEVYSFLREEIAGDRFFARKECCRIYKRKGYYSKDREKEIIFDLSIEIALPGQERYSSLVLLECKNYNHKVPVDDVEEFFAKVQQVAAANSKAVVVSTNSFQEGALNFARSKGIGLLRYFSREEHDWVLTRSPSSMASNNDEINVHKGLTLQDYSSKYFDYYGFIWDVYTHSLSIFFSRLVRFGADKDLLKFLGMIEREYVSPSRLVAYVEAEKIEAVCRDVLHEMNYAGGIVPIEEFCRKKGIEVRRQVSLNSGVLGTITFNPLLIEIDDKQADTVGRARFTLAHELGHLLLNHQQYIVKEACHESDVDLDQPAEIALKDIARMEWQANYFASHLLLPLEDLKKAFYLEASKHELSDRGHGLLYFDNQKCNLDTFFAITNSILACPQFSGHQVKLTKPAFRSQSG